jgi:hypothetical protein
MSDAQTTQREGFRPKKVSPMYLNESVTHVPGCTVQHSPSLNYHQQLQVVTLRLLVQRLRQADPVAGYGEPEPRLRQCFRGIT